MGSKKVEKPHFAESIYDRIILKKRLYVIITLFFILFSIYIFQWAQNIHLFNKDYTINYNLFGTIGDFIGGILGTIFTMISVLLLIRTFRYQQVVTRANAQQLETERFNNLFFELLKLYQNEVNELCGEIEEMYPMKKRESNSKGTIKEYQTNEIKYNNKDFFDFEKGMLQKFFRNRKSYEKNKNDAIKYYMLFYTKNRTKIAAYFRTLYRIYNLIDDARLEEINKKDYLKIIRAQLTESELFFLRYNAMTYYGSHFIEYINKYHVLKHLPAFELLEFKDWWNGINKVERMGIDIIFNDFEKEIRNALNQNTRNNELHEKQKEKYNFNITIIQNYDVNIILSIDSSLENRRMEFLGFAKFDDKKIQRLLDCFLKELFIYSNFEKYNKTEELIFYSNPIMTHDGITTINSGVKNKNKNPLKLKYDLFK